MFSMCKMDNKCLGYFILNHHTQNHTSYWRHRRHFIFCIVGTEGWQSNSSDCCLLLMVSTSPSTESIHNHSITPVFIYIYYILYICIDIYTHTYMYIHVVLSQWWTLALAEKHRELAYLRNVPRGSSTDSNSGKVFPKALSSFSSSPWPFVSGEVAACNFPAAIIPANMREKISKNTLVCA